MVRGLEECRLVSPQHNTLTDKLGGRAGFLRIMPIDLIIDYPI